MSWACPPQADADALNHLVFVKQKLSGYSPPKADADVVI
jgi:hypothetical protein